MDQIGNIDIFSHGMDEMIAPFTVSVSVSTLGQHGQLMIGQFNPRCHRKRSSVQAVEGIAPEVMGRFRRLTNAGNDSDFMRHFAQIHKRLFERF